MNEDQFAKDGRHLRRERNRAAVVEALLELYAEGSLDPSSVEIAERAGLSPRSLFRYFDDVDDLCHEAVMSRQRTLLPLLSIHAKPADPVADRVDALLQQRARVFAAMGNVGRVARLRAPFLPVVATELAAARQYLRNQIARLFAPELATMGVEAGGAALMAIDALTSFEANELYRGDQLLEAADVALNSRQVLLALLRNPLATGSHDASATSVG